MHAVFRLVRPRDRHVHHSSERNKGVYVGRGAGVRGPHDHDVFFGQKPHRKRVLYFIFGGFLQRLRRTAHHALLDAASLQNVYDRVCGTDLEHDDWVFLWL